VTVGVDEEILGLLTNFNVTGVHKDSIWVTVGVGVNELSTSEGGELTSVPARFTGA